MSLSSENRLFYMGKEITKARLNGVDFFGGNILLALQNLPADLILRLQLIEDHGIDYQRTGLRSAAPRQILNLEVDDDHTRGKFTQGKAGYGSNQTYLANAGGYLFDKAKQAAVLLGSNNVTDPGAYVASSKINPDIGAGINTISGVSASYANKFSEQDDYYLLYAFNNTDNEARSSSLSSQTFEDQSSILTEHARQLLTRSQVHEFGGWYQPAFHWTSQDGRTVFHVNPILRQETSVASGDESAIQEFYEQDNLVYTQSSSGRSHTDGSLRANNADLNLHHTLKNKHVLAVEFVTSSQDGLFRENVTTELKLRDEARALLRDSLVHQEIVNDNRRMDARVTARYSLPLEGAGTLALGTVVERIHQRARRSVSDVLNHDIPIDSLGSYSGLDQQQTGMTANWIGRIAAWQMHYTLGAQVFHLWQHYGDDERGVGETRRAGFYAVPSLRIFTRGSRTRVDINYRHQIHQPDYRMLNPVPDHRNPYRIVTGNPGLKAGLEHNLLFELMEMPGPGRNSMKTYQIGVTYYTNRTVQDLYIVPLANGMIRQELHFRSLSGDVAVQAGFNANIQRLALSDELQIQLRLTGNGSLERERYYEAGQLQESLLAMMNVNLTGSYYSPTSRYQLSTSYRISHNTSANALGMNTIHAFRSSLNVTQQLWRGVSLAGDFDKLFNWGYQGPANTDPFGIHLSLEGNIHKSTLTWKLSANDLLGQGISQGRSVSRNEFVDYRNHVLGRYVLASLNWRLGKFGGTF